MKLIRVEEAPRRVQLAAKVITKRRGIGEAGWRDIRKAWFYDETNDVIIATKGVTNANMGRHRVTATEEESLRELERFGSNGDWCTP